MEDPAMKTLTIKCKEQHCLSEKRHVILLFHSLTDQQLLITADKGESYHSKNSDTGTTLTIEFADGCSCALGEPEKNIGAGFKKREPRKQETSHQPILTLQNILDEYLKLRNLRSSSRRAYRNVTRQRLGDWLSLPVTDITKQMVLQRHWEIANVRGKWKCSKVQANYSMIILKALLNYAANEYALGNGQPLIQVNPVTVLSRNRSWHRIPARQRVVPDHLLPSWYKSVLSLRSRTVRDFLLLVLFTGLRRMEALTLTWDDIDLDSKVLSVRGSRSKNHMEHSLPLSSFLINLLKARKSETSSQWVFPGRSQHLIQVAHATAQLKRDSGIEFSPHDLRRTFLTLAERLETPHYALKKLANHNCGTDVTSAYIIVNVERLRKPMQLISDKLLELMQAGEQSVDACYENCFSVSDDNSTGGPQRPRKRTTSDQ
jgi:integrase